MSVDALFINMLSFIHTLFFFVVALAILIAVHEYGHFWVARRLGVKVLRFSLGFGRPVWRRQASPDSTEFTVGALPLGGYVKMVDEREGEVAAADLPYAFNRKPVAYRAAIVAAGPAFNFALAIVFYWAIFMAGETGLKPVLGPVAKGSLAEQAGFLEGDLIVAVGDDRTPTWNLALGEVVERAVDERPVTVTVRRQDGIDREIALTVPKELAQKPEALHKELGFRPREPEIPPIVERVESKSSAEVAGLRAGDRIISGDGAPIDNWKMWVEYVRARPGVPIKTIVERGGGQVTLEITPKSTDSPEGAIGRIGAAVKIPEGIEQSTRAEYRLGPLPALGAALEKTTELSVLTLKMVGKMLIGKVGVENLSGPISIAQYAGQSASIGVTQFIKFLAIVSISLGVLNLLPIPVLDGGHLLFYLIEALKGSPVSDRTQAFCQQIGVFLLLCLMSLALVLDIERLFA